MSFKFGFSGDDIEEEENNDVLDESQPNSILPINFMHENTPIPSEHEPTIYKFGDLIPNGVRISYTKETNLPPKRDFFDIKHQLMTRDHLSKEDEILLGSSDLETSTYEGGLKVWECSFDLIKTLENSNLNVDNILELGCGTAIPMTFVFKSILEQQLLLPKKLTLADFNLNVLKLVTAPNMLLTWMEAVGKIDQEIGEVEITDELINEFTVDVENKNIEINFISGAWSSQFVKLLQPTNYDLVLASETIYSLETIGTFTDTMINCLDTSKKSPTALIAAKKIYFGVGGGIPEFQSELKKRNITWESVYEDKHGVGRAVLRISK